MTVSTLFRFLVGKRRAILEVAETKSAVWLGLLFVASAGFAREYDGEDLLHEPWRLILPLAASLSTSFVLFCLVWLAADNRVSQSMSFFATYRMFLGLYWMTAPLAWVYAAPVERFLSAADATRANLGLLGIVAAWRVVLMVRVTSVVFQARFLQSLPIVMLFADTVALVLLKLTPLPVISIMGGIHLTESEEMTLGTAFVVGALGVVSWPLWLIGALFVSYRKRLSRSLAASTVSERRIHGAAWALGLASLLAWVPVLPRAQAEQRLRREVENDLRTGHVERALATMSRHRPTDFPPHWDPPPRIGYGEEHPPILEVVEAAVANDASPWVSGLFLRKLGHSAGDDYGSRYFWGGMESHRFDRYLNVLESLPNNSSFIEEHRKALAAQAGDESMRTEFQQARVRALLGDGREQRRPQNAAPR